MKKRQRCLLLFFCLSIAFSDISSQDIHFSQIFETPLLRNPALGGLFKGDVRIQSVFRSQWNSITVPYQTTSLNGEFKLPIGESEDYLTIGGQVLYDKAGTVALTSTHVMPAINYHKVLSAEKNMYLSLGFMGGWVQRKLDPSKMTTNSQFDGSGYNENLSTGEYLMNPSYSYLDGSAGLSFNCQLGESVNDNMYVGLAYHHFNRSKKISFYSDNRFEMEPKWVGSAGVRMSMTDYSYFTIESDISKQGTYTELITGALYTWKLDQNEDPKYSFHAGAYMRWKDALIPVAKLEFRPLAVAFSYDANISQLKAASRGRGGFEVSLTYQKYLDRYNTSRDAVRCPQF